MQSEMIEKIAIDCDILVRASWRYVADGAIDEWMDYSDFFTMKFDDAVAKNPWALSKVSLSSYMLIRGDCDDQAMTTLCLMHKRGVPLDRLFVGGVYADENQSGMPPKNSNIMNHAVGMVEQSPGVWRIVGDTFAQTYLKGKQPFSVAHRFIAYGPFTDPKNLFAWTQS